ncbi:glycosyltransferase family 2 protein [Streptomyces sp. NPDC088775]|uniref:glycosyltransferase family 2 protein n=1 Tax=Streptomyces sp. NPDC088775 TaxID=3365896 RepID=UPI0037FEE15E
MFAAAGKFKRTVMRIFCGSNLWPAGERKHSRGAWREMNSDHLEIPRQEKVILNNLLYGVDGGIGGGGNVALNAVGSRWGSGDVQTQFLIPVWNDLLSLVLCLPSILQVADFVVICDDGSNDGTSEYIEAVIAAKPRAKIRHLRSPRQMGWTLTRQVLDEYSDPSCLRVWADADDMIVPELWSNFLDGLSEDGCLPIGFYEVWGDLNHSTHWGLRGDPCHIALWPGNTSLKAWDREMGFTMPVYEGSGPSKVGPMCAFHMNGYKVDERLAFKGRRLQNFNRPGQGEKVGKLECVDSNRVHAEAMKVLFDNYSHRPAPMPTVLTEYLSTYIPSELRFMMTAEDRLHNNQVVGALAQARRNDFRSLVASTLR